MNLATIEENSCMNHSNNDRHIPFPDECRSRHFKAAGAAADTRREREERNNFKDKTYPSP